MTQDISASVLLARNVRIARAALGWTGAQLAVRAGIGLRTLNRIELGEDTTLGTVEAIARALGTDVSHLLRGQDESVAVSA